MSADAEEHVNPIYDTVDSLDTPPQPRPKPVGLAMRIPSSTNSAGRNAGIASTRPAPCAGEDIGGQAEPSRDIYAQVDKSAKRSNSRPSAQATAEPETEAYAQVQKPKPGVKPKSKPESALRPNSPGESALYGVVETSEIGVTDLNN